MNAYYEINGEYVPVKCISEVELTTETEELPEYFRNTEFSADISLDVDEFLKVVLPRGYYNAYRLRKDKYLSEKNGLMKEK